MLYRGWVSEKHARKISLLCDGICVSQPGRQSSAPRRPGRQSAAPVPIALTIVDQQTCQCFGLLRLFRITAACINTKPHMSLSPTWSPQAQCFTHTPLRQHLSCIQFCHTPSVCLYSVDNVCDLGFGVFTVQFDCVGGYGLVVALCLAFWLSVWYNKM